MISSILVIIISPSISTGRHTLSTSFSSSFSDRSKESYTIYNRRNVIMYCTVISVLYVCIYMQKLLYVTTADKQLYIIIIQYSGTSVKGQSEKGTTSLQRILSILPAVYLCMELIHFQLLK